MKEITPIDKIDTVLEHLKKGAILFDDLLKEMKDLSIVSNRYDLIYMLDKLLYDRFAIKTSNHYETYLITYEGLLFHGYRKQKKIDDINLKTLENNASQAKKYANRLLFATWVAGVAALLLLLWQIFLYLYPVHKDYPLFFFQK